MNVTIIIAVRLAILKTYEAYRTLFWPSRLGIGLLDVRMFPAFPSIPSKTPNGVYLIYLTSCEAQKLPFALHYLENTSR